MHTARSHLHFVSSVAFVVLQLGAIEAIEDLNDFLRNIVLVGRQVHYDTFDGRQIDHR